MATSRFLTEHDYRDFLLREAMSPSQLPSPIEIQKRMARHEEDARRRESRSGAIMAMRESRPGSAMLLPAIPEVEVTHQPSNELLLLLEDV